MDKIVKKSKKWYAIAAITFFIALLFFLFQYLIIKDLPKVPASIFLNKHLKPTKIYSQDGYLISALGGYKSVKLQKISKKFISAIIATEDHRFWKHFGLSKIRILKAIYITLFIPSKIQGASTITQQLTKNFFFNFKKTYLRKIRELLIAFQIEFQFSKEEILEAYVNHIFFGFDTYGVEKASNFFFAKSASNLSLAEAALLAGLPKSPNFYNPYRYPQKAKKRQMIVLKRMLTSGFINKKQLSFANKEPLKYRLNNLESRANNYFIDFTIKYLKKKYSSELIYYGGLSVYTTIDLKLQKFAEAALNNGIKNLEKKIKPIYKNSYLNPKIDLQGAIVSIDVFFGAVKVMVGGKNFYETQFNRAINNNRQPGSSFKPFLYYSTFMFGDIYPDDIIIDKQISILIPGSGFWEPRNFDRNYKGAISLKQAFIYSVNTIAAQLIEKIGPDKVVKIAKYCGIKSYLKPVYSISLGTLGVSPFEMAAAFSTFASGGIYKEPYFIKYIKNSKEEILEEHIISAYNILNPYLCFELVDMMKNVINLGPGKKTRHMGFNMEIAGKTGTTNSYNDAWFTGFTPFLSTCVWVGYDKSYGMKYKNGVGVTGGIGALPIWSDFMIKASKIYPPHLFNILENTNFYVKNNKKIIKNRTCIKNKKYITLCINDKKEAKKNIKYFYKS